MPYETKTIPILYAFFKRYNVQRTKFSEFNKLLINENFFVNIKNHIDKVINVYQSRNYEI